VLTGDRPTGQLHLGHLFGTLLNRVRLQAAGLDLMVLIADYQTITDRDSPASLPEDVDELVADYLAVGIDPTRATIFAHSLVPELNQLLLPFLSLVALPELLRNPTVKDEASASGMTALNGLMLTYPVHQAADILFCQATVVPVGADQLPHVEQTRAIARRFNRRYAPDCPVFPEPEALLSDAPVLQDRPEVANLLLLTAVNERLRPVRDRRSELMRDRGYLRTVLRDGSAAARSIAQSTLARVAAAMHTNY